MGEQNLSLLEMGKMMHEIYRLLKKRMEVQKYEDVRISIEQFSLLHAISKKEEDVIQKDMADMLGKDKSAILRLIDNLEEKELVRRVVDIKDRRKNYLMVTKTRYRIIEQYMKIVDDMMEELKQGLTQAEIAVFHKVVGHVRNNAVKL